MWPQTVDAYIQYSMKLTSHGVMVSVSRRWHRSEVCNAEDMTDWRDRPPLWPPEIQRDWKGSCGTLEPVERRDRSQKGITDGWRTRAESEGRSLFRSLALPSSNLLVLCHVIKLLKGQHFLLYITQTLPMAISHSHPLYISFSFIHRFSHTDRWIDKWIDKWMDGWMDGRTDGRTDG